MPLTILSPQATTYALNSGDGIALCGQSGEQLSRLWSLPRSGHHLGGCPGNPFELSASDHGSIPPGNWNVGSVSAGFGQHHVLFWSLQAGQLNIIFHGAINYDVVTPGSSSGSGSGVLSTGMCPASAPGTPVFWAACSNVAPPPPPPISCTDVVITNAAPKYYRVHFHASALQLPEPAASLLAGSALLLSDITLQYDVARSTLSQAVWSATANPQEPAWMLSVTRDNSGQLRALLGLSRAGGIEVKAPFVWGSNCWSFNGNQWLEWCGVPYDLNLPAVSVEPVLT